MWPQNIKDMAFWCGNGGDYDRNFNSRTRYISAGAGISSVSFTKKHTQEHTKESLPRAIFLPSRFGFCRCCCCDGCGDRATVECFMRCNTSVRCGAHSKTIRLNGRCCCAVTAIPTVHGMSGPVTINRVKNERERRFQIV